MTSPSLVCGLLRCYSVLRLVTPPDDESAVGIWWFGVGERRISCVEAKNSRSHPPMSLTLDLLLVSPGEFRAQIKNTQTEKPGNRIRTYCLD
jgi:hypothetical protein